MNKAKILLTTLILITFSICFIDKINAQIPSTAGNDKTQISLPSVVCGQCVTRVEKALKKIDGVVDYKVDLDNKTATVTYDNSLTSLSALETAITKAGYDANDKRADEKAYDRLPGCCKAK